LIERKITYSQLEKAIQVSFEEDIKIIELYDPNVEVKTIDDVVKSINEKIFEIKDLCICKGVYDKGKLIGYYVYTNMLLISFSLSPKYRTRGYLREFFGMIRKDLGKKFVCRLWSKNIRAIKWLLKNDLEVIEDKDDIVQLVYLKQ
jgi:methyl coenzyme M reductase gamma subunit